MNLEQQLDVLELTEQEAKTKVELGKALNKLTSNRDFKKLILEEYFEKEASRLVMLKAEPSMSDTDAQNRIIKDIDAIGNLRQYFRAVQYQATMAEKALIDCAEHREDLLSQTDED